MHLNTWGNKAITYDTCHACMFQNLVISGSCKIFLPSLSNTSEIHILELIFKQTFHAFTFYINSRYSVKQYWKSLYTYDGISVDLSDLKILKKYWFEILETEYCFRCLITIFKLLCNVIHFIFFFHKSYAKNLNEKVQ